MKRRGTLQRGALVLAMVTIVAGPVDANIVNVAGMWADETEDGFTGSLAASVDINRGETDLVVVGVAPAAAYRAGDHLLLSNLSGEYGRSQGDRVLFRTFEHVRYRYLARAPVIPEVFAQHAYDEFRRLSLRTLLGVGPRYEWSGGDQAHGAIGVAYMFEHERLSHGDEFDDDGENRSDHRASSYLSGSWSPSKRVSVSQTFYLQPRFDRPADLRLLNDSRLVVALTDRVDLTTSFLVAHDTRPPDSIEKTEISLRSALTIRF